MAQKYAAAFCLVIFALCISSLLSEAAIADNVGTIIVKDGRQFSDVSYSVDNYFKVVKIKPAEGEPEISVSFTDIEAIIDKDGYNVAPDQLGSLYHPEQQNTAPPPEDSSVISDSLPPPEPEGSIEQTAPSEIPPQETTPAEATAKPKTTWQSRESRPFREMRHKYWNVGLRFGGNFSAPFAEYYDGVKAGIGFEGDIRVALTNQATMRFMVSRSGMRVEDNFYFEIFPPSMILRPESKLTAIKYVLYVEYYYRLKNSARGTYLYTGVGLGAIEHRMKARAIITDGYSEVPFAYDDSETKFVTSIDGGIMALMAKHVAVDAGITLDLVTVGHMESGTYWNSYDVQYAYVFDLKLGLAYIF